MNHNRTTAAQHLHEIGLDYDDRLVSLYVHTTNWGKDEWRIEYWDVARCVWMVARDELVSLIMDSSKCDHDLLHVLTAYLGMGTADALGICLSTAK